MKVYIELQRLLKPPSGVSYYLKGLIEGLQKQPSKYTYILYYFAMSTKSFMSLPGKNFRYQFVMLPAKLYSILYRLKLLIPLDLFAFKKRIYLFPNFVRRPLLRSTSITVIHDLTFLRYPQYLEDKNRKFMQRHVPGSIKKSDHIVTNSEFSKRDIMRRFKVKPKDISVVYPGIDHARFFPQKKADIQAFKKRSGIKNKYILFVGTFEPRKNLTTLIKAYVGLPDKLRSQYTLVLAGSRGWKNFLADRLLAKYEGEDIVDLGFVSDQDLPTVYSGASIFVFPSVFEGFGMPVIEAMACGTPVIAAKNSSLVEACGKAGLLFKTKDSADLRKKMTKVLSSANTRKSMRSKGIKHAKQFSWKNSAAELEKVFSKYE